MTKYIMRAYEYPDLAASEVIAYAVWRSPVITGRDEACDFRELSFKMETHVTTMHDRLSVT